MATAVQKITLASSRDIPFNKLALSQANVRRVKAGISVEELAESIARRGLIQSLHVRPVLDAEGKETGMFEVPAGGRRYRALELLVRQKRLAKTAPVPCVISEADADILIDEVSLAENIERAPLHPLDQFRAFQALRNKAMSEEAIAAAFFVDAKVVKQRLRLAAVSPVLLDVYAEDGMTLEQLMAFTVSEDHVRQEQVWDAIKDSWQKEPYYIRRLLTETAVRASDRRALFVGIEAYEAAGGYVLRDLFQRDDGGWLQDPELLDRLAGEKLKAEAEIIAAEGWKWIEAAVTFPYGHDHGLRELEGSVADLSDDERATRESLREEYDRLEAEYAEADELPDEVDQRLGEIEQALEEFERRPMIYDPEQVARAGVFVSIDGNGKLRAERGYVRPDDEAAIDGDDPDGSSGPAIEGAVDGVSHTVVNVGGGSESPEDDDEAEIVRPLPDRLISELTAHRTLALRDAVAMNPHIAMTALLHRLVMDTFLPQPARGCLEAHVRQVHLPAQAEDLRDSVSAQSVTERHERWGDHIPADDEALWNWLTDLDDESRMELLAHCVSFGINALYEKPNPYSGTGVSQHGLEVRLSQANRLVRATGLDMVAAGWKPTVNNYLGRVTKPRILEAVREGAGERASELIGHLKKGDMAKEAERLLADTGWLPEPLRTIDPAAEPDVSEKGDVDVDLPEFLAGDGEDDIVDEEDEAQQMVAAE
ncbi:ParB N-terminal domain-containing protein [Mesorhizobium sp. YM1C-6-2]|jgi:ParB family chromosome partitioning protein|uniref:ParB/RepB/Spo0J family partition protein n=1 Tax=Mesorhizobium sp. YM1C-6-2 TaxID=1827501 RepID=UPI000EF1DFAB|nr:ParB N-terminal domain-containing protein [Mesorhizobium sp. YM1C-6-2]RLP23018.1 DNA-binding protein [Mesorhizobium sp. YM1C-6-2]